jgi:WD40 repeat protein
MWFLTVLIFCSSCITIYSQNLRVLYPNGFEKISVDSEITIQWEGVGDSNLVKLEYSTDGDGVWNVIAIGRWTSYVWKNLPQISSDKCLIRVQQISTSASDSVLTIIGDTTWLNSISVCPKGDMVASVGFDTNIKLWDISTGQLIATLIGHTYEVNQILFSPDGTKLASADVDNTVKIWDVESGQELQTLNVEHPNGIYNLAFSNDGYFLTTSGLESYIDKWDVNTGNKIDRIFNDNGSSVYSVKFSPDNQTLAYSTSNGEIKIIYIPLQHTIKSITSGSSIIKSIDYNPEGNLIAAGGFDKEFAIYNSSTGTKVHSLKDFPGIVNDIDFSPDGKFVAFTTSDSILRIVNVHTGKVIRNLIGHTSNLNKVNFLPNSKKIVSNGYKDIKVWNIEDNVLQEDLSDTTFSLILNGTNISQEKQSFPLISIQSHPTFDKVTIDIKLCEDGVSTLKIYNSNGFLMEEMKFTSSGSRTIELDTKPYSNGLYFITIETPTQFERAKLMLVK